MLMNAPPRARVPRLPMFYWEVHDVFALHVGVRGCGRGIDRVSVAVESRRCSGAIPRRLARAGREEIRENLPERFIFATRAGVVVRRAAA